MEGKVTLSEKITDQSSNQSSFSEMIFKKQQPKSIGENTTQDENVQNNDVKVVRKYTMERVIFRKEFVPVLKPIEMHLVPSKLKLNNIHFRHQKRNGNVLNCISCPCSEDEKPIEDKLNCSDISDVSDISELSNKNANDTENGLKELRKNFIRLKSGLIQKVKTRKTIKHKISKKFDFENSNIEENKSENDDLNEDKGSISSDSDLYDDNNIFINYSIKPYNNKEIELKPNKSNKVVTHFNFINHNKFKDGDGGDNNKMNLKKRNRINSMSILDTLKNRLKFDK
jgi:hypothetical protein